MTLSNSPPLPVLPVLSNAKEAEPKDKEGVRGGGEFAKQTAYYRHILSIRLSANEDMWQWLVGARGFEPPTPASRTRCATELRYAPTTLLSFTLSRPAAHRVIHAPRRPPDT